MNPSGHSSELENALALYALDLLEGQELGELEQHLAAGCAACEAELRELRETAASLAFAAPASDPPPSLRGKVLSLTQRPAQIWQDWEAPPPAESHVLRSDEGAWEEIQDGISVRRLSADPGRDTVTMLIRMAPATSYGAHRHAGPEQCYVLEGDLRAGDLIMHAGDYQCLPAGTVHGVQSTESGCLLLIVSSMHDELIA